MDTNGRRNGSRDGSRDGRRYEKSINYQLKDVITEKELCELLIFRLELELNEKEEENRRVLKEVFNFDKNED